MKLGTSILVSALTWPLHLLIGALILVSGIILIPIAVFCGAYKIRRSKYYDKSIWAFTWPIMTPFNNEEDGCCPPEYQLRYPKVPFPLLIISWAAFRNPRSGVRWTPYLSVIPQASKIQYVGSLGQLPREKLSLYEAKVPLYFYCWQGAYSCLWYQFKIGDNLWRLWIGTKLYPDDLNGGPYGYRKYGAGFATQFKAVQKGDNKN